ncbi:MAG: ATP-binding cassette domain-containing protein [Candidatus Babeliaceae bacterium]|jgi:polar amino acid transport system ATP-binding protein
MLSINNLSKTFNNKKILDNISLSVAEGEVALLLGASGVGKSTLLRILNALEPADSGVITYNNSVIHPENNTYSHIFGMVFQQFNLFDHMTVLDNITFPLEKGLGVPHEQAILEARLLLREYNLSEQEHVPAVRLSGGQKQRLAIARALSVRPRVICMDEPTSALDPLLTNYVADSIQRLADQRYTVLVASHDTHLIARLACTIYLMDGGKIVQTAFSDDFKKSPENYPLIYKFVSGH